MEEQESEGVAGPPAALRLHTLHSHPLEDLATSPLSDEGQRGPEAVAMEHDEQTESLHRHEALEPHTNGIYHSNFAISVKGSGVVLLGCCDNGFLMCCSP